MTQPAPIVVSLDPTVYRLAAIKKAAYRFGDRCHVEIAHAESGVRVVLTPKRLLENAASIAGEFLNEALDQELREVIAEETLAVRNVLMAQAFSQTALLDPVGESADATADPLGIRGSRQPTSNGEPST